MVRFVVESIKKGNTKGVSKKFILMSSAKRFIKSELKKDKTRAVFLDRLSPNSQSPIFQRNAENVKSKIKIPKKFNRNFGKL